MSNTRLHKVASFKTSRRKLYLAMLAASQFMAVGHALAAPNGGQVVGGAGSIDQAGSKTTIHQETERMAIDWKSFDVKADEHVQFIQPNSTSVALNRVLSNKGSEILGRIDANGQVILVNPNGIVFGKNSQINVGGMIASGLNINPNDFMNGEFTLTAADGTEGKIINSGIINAATGGSVTLIGKEVKNDGLISAHLGSVNLAAGKAAVVTFDPSGMVGVKITEAVLQNDLGLDAAVINSGEIDAQGGRILITASVSQDIFSQAVNNGGMNQANSVVMNADGTYTLGAGADVLNTGTISTSNINGDAGQIVLLGNNITSSGNILADTNIGNSGNIEVNSTDITQLTQAGIISAQAKSSGVGGDVKVLGNKVGLFDIATVNASGTNGGGQILIGGDQTGKNKNIRNADFIYLGESTLIKNDALVNGDGGKLITFAGDTARIYGSLSARGGIEGGNGGFIETSGLKGFEIVNTPDVRADIGHAGTWLIDPYDITITSNASNKLNPGTFTANGSPAKVNTGNLRDALVGGANVIVSTGSSGGENGDITLFDLLNYFDGTLTLSAANDIKINNNITRDSGSGKLNLTLTAGGRITFASGATIQTKGGNITATGIGFDSSAGIIDTSSSTKAGGGDIEITATGDVKLGILRIGYNATGTGSTIRLGSVLVDSENDVYITSDVDFNDSGAFGASPNGELSSFTINAKNDININASITDGNKSDNRDRLAITLNANSDHLGGGSVSINAGDTVETRGANFIVKGVDFTTGNSTITSISTGNPFINDNNSATDYDDLTPVGGDVTIDVTGAVKLQSAIDTNGGNFSVGVFSSGAPVSRVGSFTNNFTNGLIKTYNAYGGGNISIASLAAVDLGDISFGYNYLATDTGHTNTTVKGERLNVTQANQLKRIGSVTIDTGTDVTLHNAINYNDTGKRNTGGTNGYQGTLLDGKQNTLTITAAGDINIIDDIIDNVKTDARDDLAVNLNSLGGNVNLAASKTIATRGANFTVGSSSSRAGSFNSYTDSTHFGTIDTGSATKGGNINIYTTGDAALGAISFGGSADTSIATIGNVLIDSTSGNINLAGAYNYYTTGSASRATFQLLAGGDITLSNVALDNGSGARVSPLDLNFTAGNNIAIFGDDINTTGSQIWLSGGNAVMTAASGGITLNEGTGGTEGGSVTLSAAGAIKLDGKGVSTGGGDFTVLDSSSFRNDYSVNSVINTSGGVGGNTSIKAATSTNIGKILTKNLTLNGAPNTTITQSTNAGYFIDANGVTTINVGAGIVSLENTGNDFHSDVLITSAGNTSLHDKNAIILGASNITGAFNLITGGSITQAASSAIVVSGITSLDATDQVITLNNANNNFSEVDFLHTISTLNLRDVDALTVSAITTIGNNIKITAPQITLNGNLNANGVAAGGSITLTGATEITDDIFISSTGVARGNIIFNDAGTLSSTSHKNLSLTGSSIAFNGDIGDSSLNRLGELTINSSSDVNAFGTTADFFVKSLDISAANNFYAKNINTVNSAGVGGTVSIVTSGNGATGTVITGDLNTSAGGMAASHGGQISITGSKITTGKLITNGVNTGQGGAVTINASTGGVESIFIGGDIDANGGAGGAQGNVNLTLGVSGISGAITLSNNSFISSNITVTGNTSSDTLTGLNTASTWAISATNSGTIRDSNAADKTIIFTDFENLVGGNAIDTFNLNNNISQSVGGGSGGDIFNINSNITGTVSGNLGDDQFNILAAGLTVSNLDGGVGGTDIITGSNNVNSWSLTSTGTGTLTNTGTINFTGMETVTGGTKADNFTVAASGITMTIIGGENTPTDNAIDTLTGFNDTNFWTSLAGESGNLVNASNIITFTQIETLNGGSGADTFTTTAAFTGTLNGNVGADTFNLNHNVGGVNGGDGDDIFDIFASITTAINGGAGADIINAPATTNIWTLTGADAGTLASSDVINFSEIETLNGGSGADTLNSLATGANSWILNTRYAGTLNGLNFSGMENLAGNDSADTVTFASGFNFGALPTLDAKNGINTVDYSQVANKSVAVTLSGVSSDIITIDGVTNVSTIKGNNANSVISIASGTEVTWSIATPNCGAISNSAQTLNFINFSTLNGSAANNIFSIANGSNFNGTINGGSTTNTLNNLNANSTWTLTGSNAGSLLISSVTTNFSNIQTLGGSNTDTLVGSNQTNVWNITSHNYGTLNTLNFWGMKNLNGGTVEDKFTFSSTGYIDGVLDGGGGVDSLTTSNDNNTWKVTGANSGNSINDTASRNYFTSFQNIEKLVGGTGNDIFQFGPAGSIIDADGGSGAGVDAIDYSNFSGALTVTLGVANINGVHGIESFTGNGNSTLEASNATGSNAWNLNGTDKGSVTLATDSSTISFVNFKNLVAGNGGDVFDLTSAGSILTGKITGGSGVDEIKSRNLSTQWNVTGTGSGSLIYGGNTTSFDSVEKLTGSAAQDTFTFLASGAGFVITGGDGAGVNDVLDLSAINQDINLALGGTSIGGVTATGIEDIRVNTTRNNTLTGYAGGSNWQIDSQNGGTVTSGGVTTIFKGFYRLIGADNQNDTFTFVSGGSITGSINGGAGVTSENKIIGLNSNSIWTITNANSGNISSGGTSYLAQFDNIQTLVGGSGNDTFDFSTVTLGKIDGTIDGGLVATNTIKGRNTASTWDINAVDMAKVTDVSGIYINNFKNVNTVQGGTAVDTFNINVAFAGVMRGGDGNDIFNVNSPVTGSLLGELDNDTFSFSGASNVGSVTAIDGGNGAGENNILIARDASNTWNISNTNAGSLGSYVTTFNNIQTLQGGTNVDNFIIGSSGSAQTINGGTGVGQNTLTGSNIDTTWNITSANSGNLTNVNSFTNIQVLQGGSAADNFIFSGSGSISALDGGTGGSNTVTGRNDPSTWTITGPEAGSVALTDTGSIYANFNNIQILQGGNSDDIFSVGNFSGSIYGGGGLNSFRIDTAAGNLIGGDGDDNFVMGANGSANSIDGGNGNNTLTGRDSVNTWAINGQNSGTLKDESEVYVNSFSRIQNLKGGSLADNFIFDLVGQIKSVDGGANLPTAGDSITGRNTNTTWDFSNSSLTDSSGLYATYKNIEILQGGLLGNIFNINKTFLGDVRGGGSADTFNVTQVTGNLLGGAGADIFIFNNAGSASLIDGGADSDTLNLNTITKNISVGFGVAAPTDFKITAIEQVNGNNLFSNTIIGDATASTWTIDGNNQGKLNTLSFNGFENLTGNVGSDNFIFTANGMIGGVIDGGTSAGVSGVIDTVNLTALNSEVTVELGNVKTDNLNLNHIETIIASESLPTKINKLIGYSASNSWLVDGASSGSVWLTASAPSGASPARESVTTFNGFSQLRGGVGSDNFEISKNWAGAIDGGDGTDFVDYSKNTSDISIVLGGAGVGGVTNVEGFVGNSDANHTSTITLVSGNNIWDIGTIVSVTDSRNDGVNDGVVSINGSAEKAYFINFNKIIGGSGKDIFNVTGILNGTIQGNEGDDILNLNVAPASVANLNFIGGLDTNTINITGGADNYSAAHISEANVNGMYGLSYSNPSNQTYNIFYSNVVQINDGLIANVLTITDSQNVDALTLKNNAYSFVGSPDIQFSNKKNLIVSASDSNDQVILDGAISGLNEVSIRNASVSTTANGSITANSLNLNATGNIGSTANRLNANITSLSVSAGQGDIYLQAPNNLNITEFSTNHVFDVISNGNVTSSGNLSSLGDFKIVTTGNIFLENENTLGGNLNLSASGGDIKLHNLGVTNLTGLTAQNLDVNSAGAINGNGGAIKVGGVATFTSGDDINLNNAGNNFNSLTINSANNVDVVDLNSITLTNITASRDITVHSQGITSNGAISSVNVTLDAGAGLAALAKISVTSAINVNAQGITNNGDFAASTIDLNGTSGDVILNGKLDTTGKQTINVAGKSITQNTNISSGGTTSLRASENLTQSADILSSADISVVAGGNLNLGAAKTSKGVKVDYAAGGSMNLSGSLSATNDLHVTAAGDIAMGTSAIGNSANGNINYVGNNVGISALTAANGDITLNAKGAITDTNSDFMNVTSKRFVADAVDGIGVNDSLELTVGELSLSNLNGAIKVDNSGNLVVDRLRTNGNINLHNLTGNVVLNTASSDRFVRAISDNPLDTNALTSLGTSNANYNIGSLSIEIDKGNLTATGVGRDKSNPDITAYDAVLTVHGDIGEPTRPLVVYVKHLLATTADGFNWTPYYGFGVKPEIDKSTYKGNIADLIGAGSEQLVQVETLDEVNQAVFTSVRNYVYDDIAILMPADQRYDDKDSDE